MCGMLFLVGCATTSSRTASPPVAPQETVADAATAIDAVADAVTGTQQAKYCPVCGRHYSHTLAVCPQDGAALKDIE